MKRVFDALFTAVALLLSIPTVLILVSWNAIPGDKMYPLKSGLEDAVILVFSGTPLLPEVSMKFTDRRLNEATVLLSKKGSTVGYELLVAEAKQTQTYIAKKSDSESSVQFSKNIDGYKKEIEKKKIEVKAEIAAKSNNQPTTVINNYYTTNVVVPSAAPTPTEKPVSVTIPSTTSTQTTSQEVVVNRPVTVVIQEEDLSVVLQNLENTETELNAIQQEVEHDNKDNKKGNENKDGNPQGNNNN